MEHKSYWEKGLEKPSFQELEPGLKVNTLVIGGGLTGMISAYLLHQSGVNVALVESHTLGAGVSGKNSGHLTYVIDAEVQKIIKDFGLEEAKMVRESGQEAIALLRSICEKHNIDADFTEIEGYYYSASPEDASLLEDEFEASIKAGYIAELTKDVPLPWKVEKAIRYPGQAEYHPLKVIFGIAGYLKNAGVSICEYTRVEGITEEPDFAVIETNKGEIIAENVIVATHSPILFNPVQTMLVPYRSYVMAVSLNTAVPKGLFWDTAEPYRYIRNAMLDGEEILIIGGYDHKTGSDDENKAFEMLEHYIQSHFDVKQILMKWSGQFFEPADGLPLIGKSPFHNRTYIATGYSGDGLLFSIVASKVLNDIIAHGSSPYEKLYSPGRLNIKAGWKEFMKENLSVAGHFIKDRLITDARSFDEIMPDEGKIMRHKGDLLAVYRNASGELHAVSPYCRHMKCVVNWNNAEKTWDCPCHGGRYSAYGEVLESPPAHDLEKIEVSEFVPKTNL